MRVLAAARLAFNQCGHAGTAFNTAFKLHIGVFSPVADVVVVILGSRPVSHSLRPDDTRLLHFAQPLSVLAARPRQRGEDIRLIEVQSMPGIKKPSH